MTGPDLIMLGVGVVWAAAITFTVWWVAKDAQYADLGEGIES